jgi:hypothetical protein|tara:strand:+ start:630 stop:1082 length:453 start_codon:yes stop_codon:yes gene_type:complete
MSTSKQIELLRKIVRELIQQELGEASMTGNLDGGAGPPKTPYAFQSKPKSKKDKDKEDDMEKATGYKKVNEGRYHDWRNDETMTPKQKIGKSVREVRHALDSLDKTIKMSVRLKNELNVDSRNYWKNTHKALQKISERLVKLATKVGSLK